MGTKKPTEQTETPRIKGILTGIIPKLGSLRRRGVAGWMVLLGATIVLTLIVMTVIAPIIAPYGPLQQDAGPLLSPPSPQYPLGTDNLGYDMLSRILWGGGIMLQVSFLAVAFCLVVGVPLGLFSSYVGGKFDRVMSLLMDSFYAFPGLVLAIAVAAVLGRGVVNMAVAISVVYVPSYFRVVRSQVLTIKELPYTEAAKSIGAKNRSILRRYILPNVVPSIVVVATINFADAILTAAGLDFIGLGVERTMFADWGIDLTNGASFVSIGAWWVLIFPGIMIVLLALGFTLMGDGMSEMLNPKLRERGGQ
jgi:peptide/nickel transport system permease protein